MRSPADATTRARSSGSVGRIVPYLVACAIALIVTGCRVKRGWYSKTRRLYYDIPVSVNFAPADEELARKVWAYLESVDDVFNDYRADSEIGRVKIGVDHCHFRATT